MVTLLLFILGSAMGSFSLATAYRLRHKLDWVKGRSECEFCQHRLAMKDLIPLFSWLSLKGRCRYCHHRLSTNLILSELGLGLIFAASYIWWPTQLSGGTALAAFITWLLILVLFSILFWYDLKWLILPNRVVYPLIALSILFFSLNNWSGFGGRDLIAVMASIAVSSGLFLAIYLLSKGKWIGFGDVRLGVALGLLAADPLLAALNLFLASLIGTAVVLPVVYGVKRKLTTKLPFGPLLIVAAIIVRLFGQKLVDWYLNSNGF